MEIEDIYDPLSNYFTPTPSDDLNDIIFPIKNENKKLVGNDFLSIDCEAPEIGTKIEKDILFSQNINQNNLKIDLEQKKDFYNNKVKEVYFFPVFNMDKKQISKETKYNLTYYGDNKYDLFIYKHSKQEEIKIQINNKNIIQIIYNINEKNDKIELFLFLKTPPKVYIKEDMIKCSEYFFFQKYKKKLKNFDYDNLYRNINPNDLKKYYKVKHPKLNIDSPELFYERNEILKKVPYQREVSYFSMDDEDDEFINLYLNDFIIKINFNNNRQNMKLFDILKDNLKFLKVKIKNKKNYYIRIDSINMAAQSIFKGALIKYSKIFYDFLNKLIPNLQFSLMSLLTIQQINPFSFDLNILSFLSRKNLEEQEKAVKIIDEMNKNKNYTHLYLNYENFMKDYSFFETFDYQYNNNNTKSILITPSRIIYLIPTNSTNNHFQRKIINYNDSIIEINIVDEDQNNFSKYDMVNSEKLKIFIKTVFKEGITLGFTEYKFIGSSNSQMKNLGGWMVNLEGFRAIKHINNHYNINSLDDGDDDASYQLYQNCDEIIDKFGDFSKELNIFKNTSRKGMIFSETKYVTDVDIHNIIPLEDEQRGKYIITDGIGKISRDLIELSAKKWGVNDIKLKPISAIQIRFMGSKGVLAVDPLLENGTVHLRYSQIKYQTNDTSLNVCSVGNYKEAFLNRQFIILLSSLGVKDEVFEKIENQIIKRYTELLDDPYTCLSNKGPIYYEFKNRLTRFIPDIDDLIKNKIDLKDEPLFSQFINIFVYSKLLNIKYTGKLNDKKCVCLMGVIDETNTLEEDQVFIHLVHTTEFCRINKILNQKVTVYRSPSLYPGDIKILEAINTPALSHMVNVIVFSKKGKRPTFNKLSGGDLDGDRYFVSFNDYITNNIIDKNCESLEDPKYENKNNNNILINRKYNIDDAINCIIQATENDTIGIICDNHMALADKEKLKAFDPKCIKLCKYFNREIDACKTGDFIGLSILKDENLIVMKRPDFLSNGALGKNKMYESHGILGKLYRKIDRKSLFDIFKLNFFNKAIQGNYKINEKYITRNCFIYLEDAYKIYNEYRIKIYNLMKKYNFCTESELFLSLRIFKNNRAVRGKGDSYNIELNKLIDFIHSEIIKVFKTINEDVASAIFIAGYINIESVFEKKVIFSNEFDENLAILLTLFENERNIFKDYNEYENLKIIKEGEIKNKYKKIFSLPWIIKEIRDFLLKL